MNCSEVVALQQGGHICVNISRSTGEEVTGTRIKGETEILEKMKERKSEGEKRTFNYFPRPRLKTFLCDGHTNRMTGLSVFQSLLWVYGMVWMSVRFPGLKFSPSSPLSGEDAFN